MCGTFGLKMCSVCVKIRVSSDNSDSNDDGAYDSHLVPFNRSYHVLFSLSLPVYLMLHVSNSLRSLSGVVLRAWVYTLRAVTFIPAHTFFNLLLFFLKITK